MISIVNVWSSSLLQYRVNGHTKFMNDPDWLRQMHPYEYYWINFISFWNGQSTRNPLFRELMQYLCRRKPHKWCTWQNCSALPKPQYSCERCEKTAPEDSLLVILAKLSSKSKGAMQIEVGSQTRTHDDHITI